MFAQFKRDYPNVSVSIKRSDYARILESILENAVDFGFVSLPVTDNRLEAQMIHRDHLVAITAPKHPLASKKSATVAEIAAYPLVLPKLGHTRDALDALFYDHHLKPNVAMELDSSELLKRFVAAGVGVGFIARSNIEEDIRAKALVAITLTDVQIRRDLALVSRKDKSLSRAARAFMDIALNQNNFAPRPYPSAPNEKAACSPLRSCSSLSRCPASPPRSALLPLPTTPRPQLPTLINSYR